MENNKKPSYLINIGEESQVWDSDKYERNRDKLIGKHEQSQIFQLDDFGSDDQVVPGQSYLITIGKEQQEWDSDKLNRNKAHLLQKYPQARIQTITGIKTHQSDKDDLERQMEEWGAANGTFMQQYEDAENIFKKQNAFGDQIDATSPYARIFYDNAEEYGKKRSEIEALRRKYYSNPLVIQQREGEAGIARQMAESYAEASDRMETENPELAKKAKASTAAALNPRGGMIGFVDEDVKQYNEDRSNYQTAQRLAESAQDIYAAPSKYDDSVGVVNFLKGGRDIAKKADFWTMGMIGIADNMNVRDALMKVQEKLGSVDNLSEDNIDNILSPSEKALVSAYATNVMAQVSRANDLSIGYQAGQGATESLGFMAQFLLTGGAGEAVAKSATSGLTKWLAGQLGRMSSGLAKNTARSAAKGLLGTIESVTKAAVMTPMMPQTWKTISEKMVEITDEGKLQEANTAFWHGLGDAMIETWSENAGGMVENILGVPLKAGKAVWNKALGNTAFGKWGMNLTRTPAYNLMKQAGWNGFIGEMGEEWVGNTIRTITGLDPDALKDFATVDNQIITMTSFAPMSVLGLGASAAQYGAARKRAIKAADHLAQVMREAGYKEEQIAFTLDDINATTPFQLSQTLTPVINQIARDTNNGSLAFEAAMEYADAMAKYRTLDGFYQREQEAQMDDARDAIVGNTGQQFWQSREVADGVTSEEVRVITTQEGVRMFVVGQNEEGMLAVVKENGERRFVTPEELNGGTPNGPIPSAEQIVGDESMSLRDFLRAEVVRKKQTTEQERMASETASRIEETKASAQPGTQINLGTAEAPILGQIIQQTADGVMVQTEAGVSQLTWEEAANALGVGSAPMTDAEIEQQEVDAIETQRATRELQQAKTEQDVIQAETKGVEATNDMEDSQPLPVKADGSVDQTALWNQSPERWARWNDEQRQDGGANSLGYINGAIAREEAAVAELTAAYNVEPDFDTRASIEQQIAANTERLQRLVNLRDRYIAQAEAVQAVAEEVAAEQVAPRISSQVGEEEMEQADVQHQVRLDNAKSPRARREALQNYINEISEGSEPMFIISVDDYEEVMGQRGCSPRQIAQVRAALAAAKLGRYTVPAFFVPGVGTFAFQENIQSVEDARLSYVHERQHKFTRGNNAYVNAILNLGLSRERMAQIVYALSNSDFYKDDSAEVLADEIISYAMERAYTYEDFSVALQELGIEQEIIDIIINIDNEQRNEDSTYPSRRRRRYDLHDNQSNTGNGAENDRNQEPVSGGLLGSQGDRSFGDSDRRARSTGEGAEVISEEQLNAPNSGEASQITAADGEVIADTDGNGKVRFSIRTWLEGGRDYLAAWLAKDTTLADDEKADILARMDEFYQNASLYSDTYVPFGTWSEAGVRYDGNGNPLMSVIKANGDYAMNLDFSLVCKKRRPLNRLLRTLVNRNAFSSYTLRERELAEINWILQEHGFEVACALCFVDSKRYRVTGVADVFASLYNSLVKSIAPKGVKIGHFNYSNNPNVEKVEDGLDALPDEQLNWAGLDKALKGKKEGSVEYKVAQYLREHPEARRLVDATDFIEAEGFESVKENNPDLLKFYNMKKGTGGPKASFGDVQYLNDILKNERTFSPEKAYAVGGVRLQSFSDFVPHMYFDYMQLFAELAAKKLPVHAYTKEVLFAKIFGLTGAKINLSLVPAVVEGGVAPGLDAEGNYAWADPIRDTEGNIIQQGQTFPFDEAMVIQNAEGYSKNCGAIAVGISDAHIEKMLDDPNIQFIIPYHKSSLNAIVARMTNIDKYKDYTNVQNTRKATGSKLDKGTKDFNFNEHLHNLGESGTPQQAAQAYLDWCRENSFVPKFSQFAYHPNYYKLLVDFNTIDTTTGEYAPQGAVSMTFPTEQSAFGNVETLIQQGLQEDAELEEKLEAEINSIADQVLARLAEIAKEPKMTEKQQARKMAEIADERMARIRERASGTIDILEEARRVVEREDGVAFRVISQENYDMAERIISNLAGRPYFQRVEGEYELGKLASNYAELADIIMAIDANGNYTPVGTALLGFFAENPDMHFPLLFNDSAANKDTSKAFAEELLKVNDPFALYFMKEAWKIHKGSLEQAGLGVKPSSTTKYNKAIDARAEEIKAAEVKGTAFNFKKQESSLDEIDAIFKQLNKDEDLALLHDRIMNVARTLGVKVSFAGKRGTTAGESLGDKVSYDYKFFNSPAVSDQKKCNTITHELIHSVTVYAIYLRSKAPSVLSDGMLDAVDILHDVYNQIARDPAFKGEYGVTDVYEMVAELSNAQFRDKLKEKNLFQRILDALKRLLGIDTVKEDSAYQVLSDTLNYIIDNYNQAAFDAYALYASKSRSYGRMMKIEEAPRFRITPEQDKAYMDAVEAGDMETAQRMVIEAAKLAMPNTKVVDENGNPKVVYHGSTAMFTIFDKSRIGSATGTADGRGFYFTTDRDYALGYKTPDGQLFEVFLNIEKPLSYDKKTITKAQLRKILKEADRVEYEQEGEHYMLSNYANYNDVGIDGAVNEGANLEYDYADNDVELIGSLIGGSGSFDLIMDAVKKVTGKSGMIAPKDNGTIHYVVTDPTGIKSAEPVTYDNDGNVIPLSQRFNPENEDIRFRMSNNNQAIFVSNAARAVDAIKQEKATPEQWLKMIEKNGGLKAGEDKWMGLSDFLKSSDKKTLTKQEVLDFINENMIIIEEQHYSNEEMGKASVKILNEKYQGWEDAFSFEWDGYMEEPSADISDYEAAVELYNKHHDDKVSLDEEGEFENMETYEKVRQFGVELSEIYHGSKSEVRPIDGTREQYTTQGLQHLREIALTVPTIESWGLGRSNTVHFEDAGDGRAIAWIRFGDAQIIEEGSLMEYEPKNDIEREIKEYIEMGMNKWGYPFEECVGYAYNQITDAPQESVGWTEDAVTAVAEGMRSKARSRKVLVIDEIQSKRHQEGRERGYMPNLEKEYEQKEAIFLDAQDAYINYLKETYNVSLGSASQSEIESLRAKDAKLQDLWEVMQDANGDLKDVGRRQALQLSDARSVPDAPFDKNWHELAMKRMLRYAAENGYDVVAWTKGDQQAERYNIGSYVSSIEMQEEYDGKRDFGFYMGDADEATTVTVDENGTVVSAEGHLSQAEERPLADLVGKDMAVKMMQMEEYDVLEDTDLKVGNEGMKGFYDKMLPAFMNKYGKKWGIKVEDIELPNLENGLTMHSVPVTEEMKASVMEGQVMFRVRGEDESAEEFVNSMISDFNRKYVAHASISALDPSSKEDLADFFGVSADDLSDEDVADIVAEIEEHDGRGWHNPDTNKIAIFVRESVKDGKMTELVISHENIHAVNKKYPEFLALGEYLWNKVEKGSKEYKYKAEIANRYQQDDWYDEMLAYVVSEHMQDGTIAKLEYILDLENTNRLHKLLKTLGYGEDGPTERKRRFGDVLRKRLGRKGSRAIERERGEDNSGDLRFRATEITPEVRDEMDAIAATAIVDGNYMKAPNGKDSNLTAEQWAMVRTKNFKAWFGDWENDPENASKVVDENGEPRVVYHGGSSTFNKFNTSLGDGMTDLGQGSYFSSSEELAREYTVPNGDNQWQIDSYIEEHPYLREMSRTQLGLAEAERIAINEVFKNAKLYPVFLNLRNPYNTTMEDFREGEFAHLYNRDELRGYDGIIDDTFKERFEDFARGSVQYVAFDPSQIKSATDNTGEFSEGEGDIRFSIRTKPAPEKTGIGYKVFYLKDGKLYPPMVANQGGVDTPVGVWLDAEEGTRAGESKTGRPQVKQGGKGTQGGSGKLAYRPGWHLGEIPYAIQFNRKDESGEKTLFPADFVWAEVEYANDVDYQEEAMSYGYNANGKFQHSLAGLPKLPTDGSYRYRTNPNPETDPWIITGAMKVNRLLTPSEVDQMVIDAGREPQKRQSGAVTDEQIEALNESFGIRYRVNENPTDAQKEAGNYKMGHLNLDGYRITIENPKGSVRRGTDSNGNTWENTLNNDYGYIRGTEGVDGDHIDVYLSDNPSEGNVFVIDQVNPSTREFDEHKVMYGFNSAEEAREAYLANYSEGWNGLGTITEVTKDEFKKWIESSHRKTKPFSEYKSVKAIGAQSEAEEAEDDLLPSTGTPTDEVVASGLDLSPAQTTTLAGNIFAALPEESRKKITEGLNDNILGLQDAILQIPTSLASKENWDEEDRQMADIVAEEMTKMAGDMTRPFSASEGLWLLYNNLNKDTDLISEASRALVRRNLGFDAETLAMQEKAKDDVRFRTVGDASANAQASMYNRGAANVWTRLKEAFVDMNASVEKLVKAIEKRSGKVAQGFENVLMTMNQQSSKGLAAMEEYEQKFLNPMFDEIRDIMNKTDFKYEDIVRYVILKHGLERNVKLAQRDARAHYQEIYDDIIAKIKGMNPAQKRTYLTNAQLRDADAKAELTRLQGVNTSVLTQDQLTQYKKDIAKAKKEAAEAAEHLVRAQKIAAMTEQDAQNELDKIFDNIDNESDSVYKEMRKNDYSGISSMFYDTLGVDRKKYATEEEYQAALMQAKADKYDNLGDIEGAAQTEVTLFENKVNTDKLWKSINNATKKTLRQQYEANMISQDQYRNLRDMFEFYVPLRGFKDNTAEDMYTYYRRPNSTGYTKPILGAEGRKTEAESPFGWIAAMAGSAIASNVKNEAKLALYYFISNRPDNGVAMLSKTWFVHTPGDVDANGKKIFRPAYPPFNEDLSSASGKADYEIWQANMKNLQKQGLAYEAGQRLNLGNSVVNISDTNKPEHIVNVKVGGKDYTIVINGNPRAAQAINGDLNIESSAQDYGAVFGPMLRWMSSVNTSYNPEFWVTNMMRDMAFTMMAVNIKEDPAYRRKFKKNYAKAFKVVSMVVKNENGTLGNSYIERMYKDFVKYGGVTGYTQIKDSETWEREIEGYLKSNAPGDWRSGKVMRGMKSAFHALHRFGESLEQVSRFAAFLTAVETGKSINEAINDAKEITVNFNRKGSGKRITLEEAKYLTDKNGQPLSKFEQWAAVGLSSIAPLGRRFIMFFNAAIQGLNATYQLWKKNKLRSIGWISGYVAVGALNAVLHAMLDDDDDYLDIPQYERRNSLMIGGNGAYFKWALPQEARAFYALGDLAVESVMGRNPHQNVIGEALKISTELLPINPSEGWKAFMPSVAVPLVELALNEDYKGAPIYNEQKWLSEEEKKRTAKWSKAYQGTGDLYVGIARGLNALTGGDKYDAGIINLQPEKMEHIVQSAFGGTVRTADKFISTIMAAFDPEEDVTVRQFPFLNRFLTINDERFKNVHVNDVYDYYKADAEHALTLEKQYKKDGDGKALSKLRESDEYKWAQIYSKYKKPIKNIQEKIKVASGTAERKELMKQQDELKKNMIKEISELR